VESSPFGVQIKRFEKDLDIYHIGKEMGSSPP
jgi:hypothetical protein